MAQATIEVNIVASDRPLWQGQAQSVTIPASEGGMGILPHHQPILTVIDQGVVCARDASGVRHRFDVADGFASFGSNHLTVAVEDGAEISDQNTDDDQ